MLDKNKEIIWSWSFTKKLLVGMSILALIVYLWCLLVMTFAPNISVYENVINALIEQTTKVYLVGVVGYLVKSSVENVFKHNDIFAKRDDEENEDDLNDDDEIIELNSDEEIDEMI